MRDYRQIGRFIRELFTGGILALRQTIKNIRHRMMEEGRPVTYPVRWDSERQRRAYFASNGFGRGIPYRRTHRYRFGWREEIHAFGGTLHNEHPAGAIGGMPTTGWQSRIHRGRWPYLFTVLSEELAKLPNEIRNRLSVVAQRWQ